MSIPQIYEQDYNELIAAGIYVQPVVNQMEVSPLMYRPEIIHFFHQHKLTISASKALHRGGESLNTSTIKALALKYGKTQAQIMLRWALQKKLVILAKTSNFNRMIENRDILTFSLKSEDIALLDAITHMDDIMLRTELELKRKVS